MKRKMWAVVPVKLLSQAKRRLAPVLPADARRQLVLRMLRDVLGTVVSVEDVDRVLVVTPDSHVAEVARGSGASVLSETRGAGLNAAVKAGLAYAHEHGATDALVLPADVPLATSDELRRIIAGTAEAGRPRVLLVPSHDGEGTNALLMSPPGVLQPSFGAGSFLRHLSQAVARKVDVQVLQASGLANDIDQPLDLHRLIAQHGGAGRYAFLEPYLRKSETAIRHPMRETER